MCNNATYFQQVSRNTFLNGHTLKMESSVNNHIASIPPLFWHQQPLIPGWNLYLFGDGQPFRHIHSIQIKEKYNCLDLSCECSHVLVCYPWHKIDQTLQRRTNTMVLDLKTFSWFLPPKKSVKMYLSIFLQPFDLVLAQ